MVLDTVLWTKNACPADDCAAELSLMNLDEVRTARDFHRSIPGYRETPLVGLSSLASMLGVGGIYVKDESKRFGLNAFKVLGGSYAMARYIAQKTGRDMSSLPYEKLVSPEVKQQIGEITFFSATDGNHGRGVAWAANRLGQKSVIYMPKGSSETRLQNIREEGAEATIENMNYDEAVRHAAEKAAGTPGGVMVQDTAWKGYEEIPSWIMQGYGTMAMEADEQLRREGVKPTHIFIQAGVGSLAGGVQGYFANAYGPDCPSTSVVEARAADCLYRSIIAGEYTTVGGDMQTIMAGLACGEPNTISWKILKNLSTHFVSAPDWVAAKGMRTLANPLAGDERVVSGESGAVGLGLLAALSPEYGLGSLSASMGLGPDSVVLLFSTEGDTDPDKYRDIVWDGEYPSKS